MLQRTSGSGTMDRRQLSGWIAACPPTSGDACASRPWSSSCWRLGHRSSGRRSTDRRPTGGGRSSGRSPASTAPRSLDRPRPGRALRRAIAILRCPRRRRPGRSRPHPGRSDRTVDLPRLDPARHHAAGRRRSRRPPRSAAAGHPSRRHLLLDLVHPGPLPLRARTVPRGGRRFRGLFRPRAGVRLDPLQPGPGPGPGRPAARCQGCLRSRLHLEPKFVEAMVNRALVELELNQLDEALSRPDPRRRARPEDLGVLASRGETLARLGRQAEAERDFAALLAATRDDPVVRVARG